MDRILRILALSAALCVSLMGCGGIPQNAAAPTLAALFEASPAAGGTVVNGSANASVVTADMKGKLISVKVGDTFDVRIPTIPTAGYQWQAMNLDTGILMQLGDPVYKADPGLNVAGGIVTLRFKVVGPGTTALNLIYASSPAGGGPSLSSDLFGITVEAK